MDNKQYIEEFIGTIFNAVEEEEDFLKKIDEQKRIAQDKTRNTIISAIRNVWPLIQDRDTQQWLIAYLYWNVPKLPVSVIQSLFGLKSILPIAQQLQLHGISCPKCNGTIYVNSRAQLNYNHTACADCWKASRAKSDLENQNRQNQFRLRQQYLHTMPYREYLQTEEWQSTRIRMLKRANFRCQLCNKQGQLNVHHRTYERRGYEDYKDLIVLCGNCHAKFHDKLEQEQ